MSEEIREMLKRRGIASTVIDMQLLGWNGSQIVIPIFGAARREVLGFRYASLADDIAVAPAIVSDPAVQSELYGRETLARTPHRVVICSSEFDRLVLESRGYPAVAIPGGTFMPEWASLFAGIEDVFVCFDRSPEGEAAAKHVQTILPTAQVAHLPGTGSGSDFFVRLHASNEAFELLLAGALPADPTLRPAPPQVRMFHPRDKTLRHRVEAVRKHVRLHDVAFVLMKLQAKAGRLVGHCPFCDDRSRSFSVFPGNDTYRCSACAVEGDVVQFLMDKESMSLEEALETLESFQIAHELYPL